MSIVTFWSNGMEQTGKTLSVAAIATYIAIEHNYRCLVVTTGYNDRSIENCFWQPKKKKRNLGLFGPNTKVDFEDGIGGLTKVMKSNKLSPDIIKNYTRTIFKDRLEVLQTFKEGKAGYMEIRHLYPEIINLANKYYDLVFVDLDKQQEDDVSEAILQSSNLIVINLSQRLSSINTFMEIREKIAVLNSKKTLLLFGRYDKYSKYSIKNISRYMGEKNKVSTIPYNTLFFEACEEAGVPDLFLRLRRQVSEDDRNAFFLNEVKRTTENIMYRLEDLQLKGQG